VLELIIISVLLVFGFLGVIWYARLRSQQRSKAFEKKGRLAEPPLDNAFGQYLDEQLAMQQQHIMGDINESLMSRQESDEPEMTLSSEGVQAAENHLADTPVLIPEVNSASQEELLLTEPDEPFIAMRSPNLSSVKAAQSQPVVSSVKIKPVAKNKEWELVLALTVIAAEGQPFSGGEIAAALNYVDMEPGEMAIFHRYLPNEQRQTLFSVANLVAPGSLKPNELSTLHTQGLVVFMRLPSPANGLLAFDAMLDAADKIAKRLNGQLKDEHRRTLTEATLEKMRSRILNFNLTQQLDNHQFKHDYSN
jgi:cell division protein ZipA